MKGVAIEAIAETKGHAVKPVVLAISGRSPLASRHGITAEQILNELMQGSETGGDLVTIRVDYLAAMIALAAPHGVGPALWSGANVELGRHRVNLVPALCLWITDNEQNRTIRVNDMQRWTPPDADEANAIYLPESQPPDTRNRWQWTAEHYDTAIEAAQQGADWAADIAEEVNAALGRAGLPRHWRDGTGRVAGATLDRITGKNLAIISPAPMVLDRAINTAYTGGRVTIHQTGRFETISQVDMNSAYPYAMTKLPSLENAKWIRRRWYDPEEEYGLWRVSWEIPHGAVSGPFPVRTTNNAILYPLAGSGWYWSVEVAAALECYGGGITITDGFAIRPQSDEKPFEGLRDYYQQRKALKASGDAAAAHVAKLALTSCYGRIAQAMQHNGRPGRWGNMALAGITTATVRAHMMRALWENELSAIAIATDSLTVSGSLDLPASPDLGGWSVKTGGDAIMLPSGVFRVASGQAAMDRVSGVERTRALGIDWGAVYSGWDTIGLALSYKVQVPMFVGLGVAGAADQWPRFGQWRVQNHEIVGSPRGAKLVRTDRRIWRLMPTVGKPIRANVYRPRTGTLGRLDDQLPLSIPDVAREHDQPFT